MGVLIEESFDKRSAQPVTAPALVGRAVECARLDQLVQRMRAGDSDVLVLRGEPGIGKTALLTYAAAQADGCRVIHLRGVESEMELPYASLHLLCTTLADAVRTLQPAHRQALEAAIGLCAGPPDRFLVGVATLGVLAAAAARQPLLCIVDDAQWLDRSSAQALAFVGRRLQSQRYALLMAERHDQKDNVFNGLPQLRLGGLSHTEARTMLGSMIHGRFDETVLGRIVSESGGNPPPCSAAFAGFLRSTLPAASASAPRQGQTAAISTSTCRTSSALIPSPGTCC
jgi:hypothetical protein